MEETSESTEVAQWPIPAPGVLAKEILACAGNSADESASVDPQVTGISTLQWHTGKGHLRSQLLDF